MRGFKKWYVQQVIIDSRDRQILYATGEDDLYRSTDSGEHWRPMQTGAGHPLRVLQVPTKPEVLVISGEDHGIRRSTDGGLSWYPARDLQSCSIYALRASADGKELYAGGYNTGLWRSTDEGGSWEQVWKDGKTEAVRAILVDPADSAHLFVGTNGTGIVESRDHGRSWHEGGLAGGQISDIEIYP
jgi:photosystem II stability/assembly factor-like uncharacterized protein